MFNLPDRISDHIYVKEHTHPTSGVITFHFFYHGSGKKVPGFRARTARITSGDFVVFRTEVLSTAKEVHTRLEDHLSTTAPKLVATTSRKLV